MRIVRARLACCALVFLLWQGLGVAGLSVACCGTAADARVADDHACCAGMAPGAMCPMHAGRGRRDAPRCRIDATCITPEPAIVMAWQAPIPDSPALDAPRVTRVSLPGFAAMLLARPLTPRVRPPRA